jgi:3-dehydroquinate dehydratase-1
VIGASREAVLAELQAVLAKGPDAVEWRADFFDGIADTGKVLALAREIGELAADATLIFTIRSNREGGQPIVLSDRQAVELTAEICRQGIFPYVDCELSNAPADIDFLRGVAHDCGTRIIASFHDFQRTPEAFFLLDKLRQAERLGLDVAKVAVMPHSLQDVLTLLQVTLDARESMQIPLITMSMGNYGAVSRLVGGVFGSALSFAIGQNGSAPGQVPIDDLRCALDILARAGQGGAAR